MASKAGNKKEKSSFNAGKTTAAQKCRATIARRADAAKGSFVPF